jgi:hypothetical protein
VKGFRLGEIVCHFESNTDYDLSQILQVSFVVLFHGRTVASSGIVMQNENPREAMARHLLTLLIVVLLGYELSEGLFACAKASFLSSPCHFSIFCPSVLKAYTA